MENAIDVEGLTKVFGNSMAVNRINFTVPKGAVVAFLGQNGAGKSTTIKMLLGLLKPSRGSSTLMGYDSQALPPSVWTRVGYVSEDTRLYDWMEVKTLIQYTSSFYSNWDKDLVRQLLRELEIPENKKLKTLSRGQRGKVALLLALAYRPELLVLDDPTAGLDPIVRHEFLEQVIALLQKEGRTIFFSTHILDEVERIADHILILNRGKILANQSLESLKTSVKRVRLTFENDAPQFEIANALNIQRNNQFFTATLTKYSNQTKTDLQIFKPIQIDTEDLNLSEIFIELVKGDTAQ